MEPPGATLRSVPGTCSSKIRIPFRWIDIDKDTEARSFVEQTNSGFRSVPTLLFPDGSTLTEPSDSQLRRKLGLS